MMHAVAKTLLGRGAGLALILLVLAGVFSLVLRKSDPVSHSMPTLAVGVNRAADAELELGLEALKAKDLDEAYTRFSEALRIDPNNALAYYYRGGILFGKNESADAFADLSAAIRLDPENSRAYFARATIHTQRQNYDLALADLTEALRLNPDDSFSLNNRAFVYRLKHEYEGAIADYEQALQLNPEFDAAAEGLAWVLATCPRDELRNGSRAVELATNACENTHWNDAISLETLAAAWAECADFAAAIERQRQAVLLTNGNPARLTESKRRLEGYENEQPWRD
jgi:tetratricopeptide (TPR) repeat protein